MYRRPILLFLVVGLCSLSSTAAVLPGSDSAKLLSAIEHWLDDDDAQSLPKISSLAEEGNIAARLLLSRIELTDRASSKFVRTLARRELLDLFRPPRNGEVFSQTWIKREANQNDPIAATLLRATTLGIDIPAIEQLIGMGEPQAAEHLIRKVAVDGSVYERETVLDMLSGKHELSPYLRGFRYAGKGVTTGYTALQHIIANQSGVDPESVDLSNDADTKNAMQFVDIGYQANDKIIDYDPANRHHPVITQWILNAAETSGIAGLCLSACSEEGVAMCANTAFGLIGGYYDAIRFDSPLESLISQARFLSSKRVVGMTLRRIATVRTDSHQKIFSDRELAEQSQCLADVVGKVNLTTH